MGSQFPGVMCPVVAADAPLLVGPIGATGQCVRVAPAWVAQLCVAQTIPAGMTGLVEVGQRSFGAVGECGVWQPTGQGPVVYVRWSGPTQCVVLVDSVAASSMVFVHVPDGQIGYGPDVAARYPAEHWQAAPYRPRYRVWTPLTAGLVHPLVSVHGCDIGGCDWPPQLTGGGVTCVTGVDLPPGTVETTGVLHVAGALEPDDDIVVERVPVLTPYKVMYVMGKHTAADADPVCLYVIHTGFAATGVTVATGARDGRGVTVIRLDRG